MLNRKENDLVYDGCDCREECLRDVCGCDAVHGFSYNFMDVENNHIKGYRIPLLKSSNTPTLECNSACLCPPSCSNRGVQQANLLLDHVTEKRWFGDGKDWGLVASLPIREKQVIGEYTGEIVDDAEARRRWNDAKRHKMPNYILSVMERFQSGSVRTNVDASRHGNMTRYINHSCQPNAFLHPVRIDRPFPPHLAVVASCDIQPGEEITLCYGEIGESTQFSTVPCLCKSAACIGWLPFDSQLT